MKKLIIGATGSIGSALSRKLVSQGKQVHLVGRNESETSALAKELNSTFTVADVLTENYSDQIISDAGDIDGLAFIGGSKAADDLVKKHPEPHRLKLFLQLEAKNMAVSCCLFALKMEQFHFATSIF